MFNALESTKLKNLVRVRCIVSIGQERDRTHLIQLSIKPDMFNNYKSENPKIVEAIQSKMNAYEKEKKAYKFRVLSELHILPNVMWFSRSIFWVKLDEKTRVNFAVSSYSVEQTSLVKYCIPSGSNHAQQMKSWDCQWTGYVKNVEVFLLPF